MIRHALRNLRSGKIMSLMIGIQTFVVFSALICMMSVVMYRYDLYRDIKGLISGDGQVLRINEMAETPEWKRILSDSPQAEKIFPYADFNCMYKISFYEHEKDGTEATLNAIGYDEALAECHTPKMAKGRWLNQREKNTEEIPVVVAQPKAAGGKYKVGQRLLISRPSRDSGGDTKKRVEMTLHIIGIVEENAQLIGPSAFNKNYTDARGLYWNYLGNFYKEPSFFVVKDDIRNYLESKNVDFEASYFFPKISGLVFVRFDKDMTTRQKIEFDDESRRRCSMERRNSFETFRYDGKKYVLEQLKIMIPVISAIVLLTLISTACNSAIMAKTNLKKYGIYYVEGLTWGRCIWINILSFLLLDGFVFVLSAATSWFLIHSGVTGKLVLSLDYREILACLSVFLFLGLSSTLIVLQQVANKSAKAVLYQE